LLVSGEEFGVLTNVFAALFVPFLLGRCNPHPKSNCGLGGA